MKADMHALISIFNATFHESLFHLQTLKPGILTVFTLDHPSALHLTARYKPNIPIRPRAFNPNNEICSSKLTAMCLSPIFG